MEAPDVVRHFLLFSMIFLGVTMCFCLLRGILGPRFTDRVVAVNVIGTKAILLIATLSLYLDKPYLLDICLIYTLMSFLAVVALTNTYMLAHSRRQVIDNGKDSPEGEQPAGVR